MGGKRRTDISAASAAGESGPLAGLDKSMVFKMYIFLNPRRGAHKPRDTDTQVDVKKRIDTQPRGTEVQTGNDVLNLLLSISQFTEFSDTLSLEPHDNPEKQRCKHREFHSQTHVRTQISSDPAGRRLAQCAGFFSPLPSLAQYGSQDQVPSSFSFLGRDPRPSAQSVTAPLLHALFRPLPRRAGDSPRSPGSARPKGGASSRGCVGGGCASRGAWAGGGRRHVETRGQPLAAQALK